MPLQRSDRSDTDRRELKLIRVGHCLWSSFKKQRGKSGNVGERRALEEALQTVWRLKREVRAVLAVERTAKAAKVREHFRKAKAA